jgi:EAL domain-containing protein (putative c-di-GMP-specific phosphodiesterase class I)
MYTAKKRGRNQFVVYDEAMHRSVLGPLTMQARLEQAIAAREFEVYYQPIVRLADHRVVTLEALVRWRDEEGGLMSPADFLGVAESTGLVAQIDRLVLTAACRDLAAWRANGRWADRIGVAVNLSAASAQQPDLPDAVDDVVRHAGLRPKDLALEVSESVLIDETDRVAVGLQELRRRGVRVALDDFGTGYSSLQYLHRFPVDTLKIALPFVHSADRTETDQTVVRAMVGLGTALGLQVVAEGVETFAQAGLLAAMGAQLGQGYLFARPVPAAELVALMARSGGTLRPTESPASMSVPR